jgi:23S rRNA pseudouridine2605 synthase
LSERDAWLEVVLDEGKNRHIRRMLAALKVGVLRLIRVQIGSLQLGKLPVAKYRALTAAEVESLVP